MGAIEDDAEARFLASYRQLPPSRQRAAIDCIENMPPGATGDEKVRRLCLAIEGCPRAVVNAIIVRERRASFHVI